MRRVLDCHVLILVLEGTLHITQDGNDFDVGAGETFLMAQGKEHYGTRASKGRLSYLWVHFCTDDIWDTAPPHEWTFHIPEKYTAGSPSRLRRLFELVLQSSQRGCRNSEEMAVCALRLLLLELTAQADSVSPRTSELVQQVSLWVRQNCHRRLTVAEIARRFHYSADYLSSRFRRETGTTLSVFLNECRIELAKSLLSNETVSIKETAYSCGFADEKYFARAFRKSTGMTPSEYRSR